MKKPIIAAILAAAAIVSGCSTTVTVKTQPEGAIVRYRGNGRATFRWITAPTTSPTTFETPYSSISVYAAWPDGTKSEHVLVSLPSFGGEREVSLAKPSATK